MTQPADLPSHPHLVDTTMFWSSSGGGVRRYLLAKQAWLCARRSWRQTIVAPGASGPGYVNCKGVPLPFSGGYRVPLSRSAAARLIGAQSPDLIEAGDPYRLAWAAVDAAQRLGVPAVHFCHSNIGALAARMAAGMGLPARWARREAQRYFAHMCSAFDLVLAPSRALADELQALGIERVHHQPLGVDTAVFHPRERSIEWRRSLGLPDDARLLLYAGRFAAEKNLPLLVQAIGRLGPRCVLLAMGSGPMPPRGAQVRVLAHEPDPRLLARTMASVDAFVHAGDQETFGLSVLEAMACGTPVVVRNEGGLAELASDGAGIAVDSAHPEAWAEAIAAAFTPARSALAQAGRLRALSHDWNVVLPLLFERYEHVLRRQPAHTCPLEPPHALQTN